MTQPFELLLLDDEPCIADMMSELLALYFPQAAIRVAYSGEDAVKLAKERRPSAAVFDLEMVGMGGANAARELRKCWPDVPPLLLVALSGNLVKLENLRRNGPFDHLLSKPVDLPTLVKLLDDQDRSRTD
ncbi:response regulator [Variovorax sp. RHLX14]|uniref:response regulator n=1 Tax=Variovorax sp. RHLX14 TaxID=1259731 RepID=UPI003F461DE6